MSLDLRKMKILQAIVDDYITTGMLVGSRTISRRPDIGLSSATIRNEMFDLKELGFLEQSHASSGSMPSDKAYRLYVNSIMKHSALGHEETCYIRRHLTERIDNTSEVIRQTAQVLSNMTNYLSMVMLPQLGVVRLKRLQIIPITGNKALLVIVSNTGFVRDAIITIPNNLEPRMLDEISHVLTSRLSNCRLKDVSDSIIAGMLEELSMRKELLSITESLAEAIRSAPEKEHHALEVSGTTKLLGFPEYNDIERARDILMAIEHPDKLYNILSDATKVEFSITIGSENKDPEMQNCSIVTATYKIGDDPLGSLGVIGPTRMNYSKVLAVLGYLSQSISEILTQIYGIDD